MARYCIRKNLMDVKNDSFRKEEDLIHNL